jgi:hypothetical protein
VEVADVAPLDLDQYRFGLVLFVQEVDHAIDASVDIFLPSRGALTPPWLRLENNLEVIF